MSYIDKIYKCPHDGDFVVTRYHYSIPDLNLISTVPYRIRLRNRSHDDGLYYVSREELMTALKQTKQKLKRPKRVEESTTHLLNYLNGRR